MDVFGVFYIMFYFQGYSVNFSSWETKNIVKIIKRLETVHLHILVLLNALLIFCLNILFSSCDVTRWPLVNVEGVMNT